MGNSYVIYPHHPGMYVKQGLHLTNKLFLYDSDGTLKPEFWEVVGNSLKDPRFKDITDKVMSEGGDFDAAFRGRVMLAREHGCSKEYLTNVSVETALFEGAAELVEDAYMKGYTNILVTGGILEDAIKTAEKLRFIHAVVANRLDYSNGGAVIGSYQLNVNGNKGNIAERLVYEHGFDEIKLIGDGTNDLAWALLALKNPAYTFFAAPGAKQCILDVAHQKYHLRKLKDAIQYLV